MGKSSVADTEVAFDLACKHYAAGEKVLIVFATNQMIPHFMGLSKTISSSPKMGDLVSGHPVEVTTLAKLASRHDRLKPGAYDAIVVTELLSSQSKNLQPIVERLAPRLVTDFNLGPIVEENQDHASGLTI